MPPTNSTQQHFIWSGFGPELLPSPLSKVVAFVANLPPPPLSFAANFPPPFFKIFFCCQHVLRSKTQTSEKIGTLRSSPKISKYMYNNNKQKKVRETGRQERGRGGGKGAGGGRGKGELGQSKWH
jgi:hypothetical protein